MTTDTLTLTAFLLARIEEDEERAASDIDHFCDPNDNADKWITMYAKRLAAECAVKRAIVEQAERWAQTLHETPAGWSSDGATAYRMAMEWTLRQLAAVYADHRDYREEWAL